MPQGEDELTVFKFHNEKERREAVRQHADIIRRGFEGEITTVEMLRLSKALLKPYRKRKVKAQKDALCAPDEQD